VEKLPENGDVLRLTFKKKHITSVFHKKLWKIIPKTGMFGVNIPVFGKYLLEQYPENGDVSS